MEIKVSVGPFPRSVKMFSVKLVYKLNQSNNYTSEWCNRWILQHITLPREFKENVEKKYLFHGPCGIEMATQVCQSLNVFCSEKSLEQSFIQAGESNNILFIEDVRLVDAQVFSKLLKQYEHMVVIGAVSELESVEPCVLRCMCCTYCDYPSLEDRRAYLEFLLKKVDHRINIMSVAEKCLKYSYFDLKHVVDTAVLNRLSDADPILQEYHLNVKPNISLKTISFLKKYLPLTKNLLFHGPFAFMALHAFHLLLNNSLCVERLPIHLNTYNEIVIINLEHFKEIDILKLLERCTIDSKIVVASFTSKLSSDILVFFNHTVVFSKV